MFAGDCICSYINRQKDSRNDTAQRDYLSINFALLSFAPAHFSLSFWFKSVMSVTSLFCTDSMANAFSLCRVTVFLRKSFQSWEAPLSCCCGHGWGDEDFQRCDSLWKDIFKIAELELVASWHLEQEMTPRALTVCCPLASCLKAGLARWSC